MTSMTEVWGKVKHYKELYAKISIDAGIDGESEEEFDARAIKILLSRDFGEEVDEVKTNIEEDKAVDESAEINCKVTVGNFKKRLSSKICESFLKQLDGVVMVKPEVKNTRKECIGAVAVFKGLYEVTFKDSSSAEKLIKLEEVKFEQGVLSKKMVYSCMYCSRSFKFQHYLRKHIARLHIKRSFQCHACPKKILRKDNFENHKQKHNAEAPNVCVSCKKQFKTRVALMKHLVNGEYCPLQCILCMKTFAKKFNLEKHQKICNGHLDDIGGTCEICFKKIQYKIDLTRHRKSFMNTDGS